MEGGPDAERRGRPRGGEGVAQSQDIVALKALLAAVEGSAKKSLRCSRVGDFLSALEAALLLSAALAAVACVFTGGARWQFAAAGAAFAAVAVASGWLQSRLRGKALKELDRLELLAAVAALATGRMDFALAVLTPKVEELKRRRSG
jgi:hypothetical protein